MCRVSARWASQRRRRWHAAVPTTATATLQSRNVTREVGSPSHPSAALRGACRQLTQDFEPPLQAGASTSVPVMEPERPSVATCCYLYYT